MSELTITQVRHIVGWSWPTAYKFAKVHGYQDNANGVWYIPFADVAAIVQGKVVEAQRMQNRLVEVGNGAG